MHQFFGANPACAVCHYNEFPLEISTLERLKQRLNSLVDVDKVTYPHRYYWVNTNKCRYGQSCQKTHSYEMKFNRLTEDMDYLLTAYIEQTDCSNYMEILQYLRGSFSNIYTEFERNVHKKLNEMKGN